MTLTSIKKSLLREQRRLREYRLKQERLKQPNTSAFTAF